MKNLKLFSLLLLLVSAPVMFGQAILVNTTFGAAVASTSTTVVAVASATGVTAPSASNPNLATYLYSDNELMFVTGVNGTQISVVRGSGGTAAATHASGALVFVIPAYQSTWFNRPIPTGSCTRGNQLALPVIVPVQGVIADCIGGKWVASQLAWATIQPTGTRLPDPGATALTTLETAGTAPSAATEQYCTEIDLQYPTLLTGLGVLNGTTVGTDKHLVILYDASGNVLANSATAGATTAGASTYQKQNFTAKYFAPAPAKYFGCVQTNGTTDTIRHAITAVNDNIVGGAVTTQVFGTVKAVTLPSSFTTAKAPYYLLY